MMRSRIRVGNVFICRSAFVDDIRRNYQQSQTNSMRSYILGMVFLLLNIFLGLLGTFWFRTQQRRGEIALMKFFGRNRPQCLCTPVGGRITAIGYSHYSGCFYQLESGK